MSSNRSVVSGTKLRLRSMLMASAMLAVGGSVSAIHAATLTWDSSGTHPTAPVDGSGTWDDSAVRWSTGSADQAWIDGNAAVIGHGNGTGPASITLGANIIASSLTFLSAGSGSYTINGAANPITNFSGYTLATTTGSWIVNNANVTLTNGTFVDGSTTGLANVTNGGSLTLGPGSIYQTAGLYGDGTGSAHFNGGTLQPSSANGYLLYNTSGAYISTGGLTVDTSLLTTTAALIFDPLLHDPSGSATDGGLTLNGGGTLYVGYDEYAIDPISTYTGPTTVNSGFLVIDTSGNSAFDPNGTGNPGPGPFPNSNFVINPAGQIVLYASDGLIGETGRQTVTINGGLLGAYTDGLGLGTSAYIGNTTIGDLGEIYSDSQSSFEFIQNSVLHVTSSAFLEGNQIGFEAGSSINIDPGAVLLVSCNIVDATPFGTISGVGQLTLNGSGTLDLRTPLGTGNVVGNSMEGPVTVNGGTLVLDTAETATGMFPSSPSITVASGASLLLGQSDTLIGTSNGSTGVILNGGSLIAASGTTNHVANLTLNRGTLASNGAANASGSFIFLPTSVITITDDSTISALGVVLPRGVALNVPAGVDLTVNGTLVDSSSTVIGQLTSTGPGNIHLEGSNTYSGPTNISAGTVVLKSTGALTKTPSITVGAGATFTDAGSITSTPAVVVNGTANFGPNFNTGIQVLNLASLSIGANNSGAFVNVVANGSHANRLLLVTGSYSLSGTTNAWTSKLDLGNNDLDVQHGNLATITNQLKAGYNANGSYWNGAHGIVSSSAASDPTYLTTLGVILNTTNGTTALYGSTGALGLFDGTSPAATDVLVKTTYYGDTNLDGTVDGTDYARIDNGFQMKLTGWYNGDFNYDGVVNGSDYTLIDNTYNQQGASLADQVSVAWPSAQIAGTAVVPEPATLGLMGMAAIGLLARRNRR